MEREQIQRLFVVATFIAGVTAAYLMHRRGVPLLGIAKKAITNPVGSLAAEVENAWSNDDGKEPASSTTTS